RTGRNPPVACHRSRVVGASTQLLAVRLRIRLYGIHAETKRGGLLGGVAGCKADFRRSCGGLARKTRTGRNRTPNCKESLAAHRRNLRFRPAVLNHPKVQRSTSTSVVSPAPACGGLDYAFASAAKNSRTASVVAWISASVCTAETKPASNCDGAM